MERRAAAGLAKKSHAILGATLTAAVERSFLVAEHFTSKAGTATSTCRAAHEFGSDASSAINE